MIMRAVHIVTLAVPTDEPPVFEWRRSFSGTPNLRMSATTNDQPWIVDIYAGNYYRATIGNGVGEVWNNMPSLIGYLRKFLGLGPLHTPPEEPEQ